MRLEGCEIEEGHAHPFKEKVEDFRKNFGMCRKLTA